MTDVTITGLGRRGEGIAEFEGKRLFVPLALPGERVAVEIEGERAQLAAVLEASAERIAPFCPHFGACGGCQLQHMGPEAYATFKRGLVVSALERAGLAVDVAPLVDAKGRGRRRVVLHARHEGSGFMHLRSHQVHDLDRCPITVPQLKQATAIGRAAYALAGECEVSLTASLTGLDVLVRAQRKSAKPEKLVPLAREFDLARLALNGEVVVQSRAPVVAMGRAKVELPVASFLQATEAAETVLAEQVVSLVGPAKNVADLFCGLGPFALRLAETARVTAHDSDKAAVAALGVAHRHTQGLKAIAAKPRDLFREPLTQFELADFDAVVLDPPRAGAEAQARELAKAKVRRLVYVSCDPVSFARDAAILVAGGYRLERVVPVDQFAFSAHVELVAGFSR
jgi:23S rRNA (uracil1939-C5)-methyltransferase